MSWFTDKRIPWIIDKFLGISIYAKTAKIFEIGMKIIVVILISYLVYVVDFKTFR